MELNIYKVTWKFKQPENAEIKSYSGFDYVYVEIAADNLRNAIDVLEQNHSMPGFQSIELTDKKVEVFDRTKQ